MEWSGRTVWGNLVCIIHSHKLIEHQLMKLSGFSIVLMKVLGENTLIGLPQNVKILHIAQLEEFTAGRTILQEILSADTERTRIIEEAHGAASPFRPHIFESS